MDKVTIKNKDGVELSLNGSVSPEDVAEYVKLLSNPKEAQTTVKSNLYKPSVVSTSPVVKSDKKETRGRKPKLSKLPYPVRQTLNASLKAGVGVDVAMRDFISQWGSQYDLPREIAPYNRYAADGRRFNKGRSENFHTGEENGIQG